MSNGTSSMNGGGGLTLQVRRGSEPALNRMSPVHLLPPECPSKRWSAAPVIDEDKNGVQPQQHFSVFITIHTLQYLNIILIAFMFFCRNLPVQIIITLQTVSYQTLVVITVKVQ
jgi:hypothetical protein